MAESEIISALNSLRACLESQLLVTNQIVKEFMSSFNSKGLFPKLTPTPTIAEFQSTFKDPMNKEGCELKCFELETKAKETDDWADSNAAIEIVENDALLDNVETKVIENAVVDNIKVMVDSKLDTKLVEVTTCEFSCNITTIEEEKLKTPDAYFADDALMLDITYVFANEEKRDKIIATHANIPLLLIQERGEKINCVVEQLDLGRRYKAHVARRRTMFKFYALKEVYIEL